MVGAIVVRVPGLVVVLLVVLGEVDGGSGDSDRCLLRKIREWLRASKLSVR